MVPVCTLHGTSLVPGLEDKQLALTAPSTKRTLIVPPGCGTPIRQELRNIFDRNVCKGISWEGEAANKLGGQGVDVKVEGSGSDQIPKKPEGTDVHAPQPVQCQMPPSGTAVPDHVKATLEAARTGCCSMLVVLVFVIGLCCWFFFDVFVVVHVVAVDVAVGLAGVAEKTLVVVVELLF